MNSQKLLAFPPIVNENSRILILGSMPSVTSLQKVQYYAHPQNAFWRILFDLWGENLATDYEARTRFLLAHGLALWDVCAACRREGSLDAAIQDVVANDFAAFFQKWPSIDRICFNGQASEKIFRQRVLKAGRMMVLSDLRPGGLQVARLPSTSPAHAISYVEKLAQWQIIRQWVEQVNGNSH